MIPAKIYKHWFGLLVIALTGLLVLGLCVGGAFFVLWQNPDDRLPAMLLFYAACAVTVITVVVAIVYMLSSVTLDANGITVSRWYGLFSNTVTSCDWTEVQDISVQRSGLFSRVLGYGDILAPTVKPS